MDNDRRLTQLEAKLTGKQRGLAWLKRQQEQRGYVELCRRGLESGGYIEGIRRGLGSGAVDRFVIDMRIRPLSFTVLAYATSRRCSWRSTGMKRPFERCICVVCYTAQAYLLMRLICNAVGLS